MISAQSLLILIITEKCNLRCAYCLRGAAMEKREIPFDILRDIVLRAYSLGYRRIGITGGEPLLYPHFREIVELLGKLRFWVFLETNGYLLDEETLLYLKANLHDEFVMLTSLDSHEEKVNDALRGNGAYSQCLKTVELIRSLDIKLVLNAVATGQNLDTEEKVDEYIKLARSLGASQVYISAAVAQGRAANQSFLVTPAQRNMLRRVFDKTNFYDGYIGGHCALLNDDAGRSCGRLVERHTAISPQGIHPCVYQENITLGGLQDFGQLMNDENLMESLNDLRRAAIADFHSEFLCCQDCIQLMSRYIRKLKDLGDSLSSA